MRLDQALVQLGLAPSRTKAQDLVTSGAVEIFDGRSWRVATVSSENVDRWNLLSEPGRVRLRQQDVLKFVSRGGLKLETALQHVGWDVRDQICLDCGQSTGGFTDCLLQAGARQVVGFDVGHDQLAAILRNDPRVVFYEGLHFKDSLLHVGLQADRPANGFNLIVADLSFVSLEKVLPVFSSFGPRLLTLVKPQFEVGSENLNKKGIVKSPDLYASVEIRIRNAALLSGWRVLDYFPSSVEGRDGNREFFLFAEHTKNEA